MTLTFRKVVHVPTTPQNNAAYLIPNNWDDYSFKTTFYLIVDHNGERHEIGDVKIGYFGQIHGWTSEAVPENFTALREQFFSLGQSPDYYEKLLSLPNGSGHFIVQSLRDLVADEIRLARAENERVFSSSLTRFVSESSIREQYRRILFGGERLRAYKFGFATNQTDKRAGIALSFEVKPGSTPTTNIHALIGRNGIGKTTILNGMISALTQTVSPDEEQQGTFYDLSGPNSSPLPSNFFSGLVSVSFSAFDPFVPPAERRKEKEKMFYSYIGLKQTQNIKNTRAAHLDIDDLRHTFVSSLKACFSLEHKKTLWLRAISFLESDHNFAEMELSRLADLSVSSESHELGARAEQFYRYMSSGHAIVLLTITRLVERAEEKTLLLMDEPESHLHPPLLSALMRSLSDLLSTLNGVALIATHSPVVLQEIPASCVWKVWRSKLTAKSERPEIETFGENVGILTREVFQLEVANSGFYALLRHAVDSGKDYDQILSEYDDQIGFEGRALLRALVANRITSAGKY